MTDTSVYCHDGLYSFASLQMIIQFTVMMDIHFLSCCLSVVLYIVSDVVYFYIIADNSTVYCHDGLYSFASLQMLIQFTVMMDIHFSFYCFMSVVLYHFKPEG